LDRPRQILMIGRGHQLLQGGQMLAALAVILIVLWLLGFLAFNVTSGLIHIALVVGLILIVMHFLRTRRI